MRTKTSQILFDYWNLVRDGRIAPQRIEIDPSALSKILSQTMILEVADTNRMVFRIAGTGICEFLGSEMRGHDFLQLWPFTDQRKLKSALKKTLLAGSPLTVSTTSQTQHNTTLASEIVLLPLHDHEERPTRLLGCWSQRTDNSMMRMANHHPAQRTITELSNDWPITHSIAATTTRHVAPVEPPPTRFSHLGMRLVRRDKRHFGVLDGGLRD